MTLFEIAITSLILLYGLLLTFCALNEYIEFGLSKQLTPPEDLAPGVLGSIEKGRVDFELVAADLFYLQNLGYVLIESESKSFKFIKLKEPNQDLPSYLAEFMCAIFAKEDTFVLGKFNQTRLCQIVNGLWKNYHKKKSSYYRPNLIILLVVLNLGGIALVLPCLEVKAMPFLFYERIAIIISAFALFMIIQKTNLIQQYSRSRYLNRQVVLKLLLLMITFILFLHQYKYDNLNLFLITLCALSGINYFSFTYFYLNRKGKKLFKKINGYKEFILHPDPEQAYTNLNEIKLEFIYKAPHAFVLAQEYPLISSYSEKSDTLKLAENNYHFFEKHFKAYLRLAHCLESVYYRKVISNKFLEFSW